MSTDPAAIPDAPGPSPRPRRTAGPTARRVGYAVATLVDVVLLSLVNVWPGWQVLPFLDDRFAEVLPWINAGLAVGAVANLLNAVFDRRWLRAFGDLATTIVGIVGLVLLWTVFPFDFGDSTVPWEAIVRTILVIAMAGSAIGAVAALVALVRALFADADDLERPKD
ncbi:hypothetical protein [Agromyces arachidis]|uniref:hypothetical protein n=1 Tax=Agromyces arachidis TaxID=766966 RepID=UPI004055FD5C